MQPTEVLAYFNEQLEKLKMKRRTLFSTFRKELEQEKIAELKKQLTNNQNHEGTTH